MHKSKTTKVSIPTDENKFKFQKNCAADIAKRKKIYINQKVLTLQIHLF